jgi:hypothetical protein
MMGWIKKPQKRARFSASLCPKDPFSFESLKLAVERASGDFYKKKGHLYGL